MTENWQRVEQVPLLPIRPLPLQCNRGAKTKTYGPNERTETPEKELSDKEIANLSDAEFKTQG